jgi:hypothetical protein
MSRGVAKHEIDLAALERRQRESLGLNTRTPVSTPKEAGRFLSRVGVALRYGATKGLPLASLYQALAGTQPDKATLTRCISLINRLLGESQAIEVVVIAERVTLVHRSLMPPLYALVRRGRLLDDLSGLSVHARTALALLREAKEVTAGEVRRRLGLAFDERRDPAYAALGELQRLLLVDRGPFTIPKSGIPYLGKEGYPYHFLHEAHQDLIAASAGYSILEAAEEFLEAYLRGAVFARSRKLASLFKAFLSAAEIDQALAGLAQNGRAKVCKGGGETIALVIGEASRRGSKPGGS